MLIVLLIVFVFMSSLSNIFIAWAIITIISIVTISFITKEERKLKYFIIQEISILLFIFLVVAEHQTFLILPLLIKTGVPPFHTWIVEIFIIRTKVEELIFLTLTKVIPTTLLLILREKPETLIFCLIFVYLQICPIVYETNTKLLLLFSSLRNILIILILATIQKGTAWLFLLFYITTTLTAFSTTKRVNNKQISTHLVFVLTALPPSPLFFIKIIAIILILQSIPILALLGFSACFYYAYIKFYRFNVKNETTLLIEKKITTTTLLKTTLLVEVLLVFII